MQEAMHNIKDDRAAAGRGRGFRAGGLIGLLAATASLAAAQPNVGTAPVPAAAGEIVVRMYPMALVSGDDVTLADVAEIEGDPAGLIGSWPVAAAPHVGQSGVLELSDLQAMLARRGANVANWIFRGSSKCTVRRVNDRHGRSAAANSNTTLQNLTLTPLPGSAAAATSRPADAHQANTLEGAVREHVAAKLAHLGGEAVIRFNPATAKLLSLARPTYDFRVTSRGERIMGMVPLEVTVLEAGKPRQDLPLLVDVKLCKKVVVATRGINRGEIIRPGDVGLEPRMFERPEDIGAADIRPLIGQRAKRFVEARSMLQARDIEPVPLVTRNELVTVIVRRGGLLIRGSAKAMKSAGYGETVELKNENSKDTFTAVVTAEKTVEVVAPAAPASNGRPSRSLAANSQGADK